MRCPRCSSENARSTNACVQCGTPLRAAKPSSKLKIPWYGYLAVGLALAVIFYFVFLGGSESVNPLPESLGIPAPTTQAPIAGEAADTQEAPSALILGHVTIRTRLGEQVYRTQSAVLGGSWIALPIWSVLGGDVWKFLGNEGDDARLTQGFWTQGMPLGFWKLDTPLGVDHPPLASWDNNLPLYWQALSPEASLNRVMLDSPPQPYGLFARMPIPKHFKTPGVFLQKNRIVGWTFGSGLDFAFLWTGSDTAGLDPNIRTSDLVGVAFADSQEGRVSQALGMNETNNSLPKLRALTEGLTLPPELPPEDKPAQLQLPSINRQVLQLANKLMQANQAQDVASLLDEQVIRASQDVEILKIAAQARLAAFDHRRALRFFEGLKDNFSPDPEIHQSNLDRFHLDLYKDWVQSDIEQELVSRGWEAFEAGRRAFPDDTELHLLGVELAIAGKEWGRAEELLGMRSFPAAFKSRASNLEVIILERKSEEGKVVIRFPQGAQDIPIDILLNKRIVQRFVLDTGASVVTIPSEALEALGITIDNNTPVRRVSTVSGYTFAYEVSLNQMEIKGQRVNNIPALVIDIPGQPGIGLLGQSFLKYFEVEIDGKKGILRLKRK